MFQYSNKKQLTAICMFYKNSFMHEECHLGQPFWALLHADLIYHPVNVKKWLSFFLVKSKWSDSPWFMLWKLKSVLMICYSRKMLYTSQHFSIHCWSIIHINISSHCTITCCFPFQSISKQFFCAQPSCLTQERVLCGCLLIKTCIFIVLLTLS